MVGCREPALVDADDLLCDRRHPGLRGRDDALASFVRLFVGDDGADIGLVAEVLHRGDGLVQVEIVIAGDRELLGLEHSGGGTHVV